MPSIGTLPFYARLYAMRSPQALPRFLRRFYSRSRGGGISIRLSCPSDNVPVPRLLHISHAIRGAYKGLAG